MDEQPLTRWKGRDEQKEQKVQQALLHEEADPVKGIERKPGGQARDSVE